MYSMFLTEIYINSDRVERGNVQDVIFVYWCPTPC